MGKIAPVGIRRVTVVGAGLGGLTVAIALARGGFEVTIVERARDLTPVGAGISLWPNALRALQEIDLAEAMRNVAAPFSSTTIQTSSGRQLNAWEPSRVRGQLGGQPVIAHRADVQQVLQHAAKSIPLLMGTPVVAVHADGNHGAVAVTQDGTELSAELVIGADGVGSVARSTVGLPEPARSPLLSWRTVPVDAPVIEDAWLSIGSGHQFLACPLPRHGSYLAGLLGMVDGSPPTRSPESLRRAYAGWHAPIPDFLERLDTSSLRWDEVRYAPPPRTTVRGRVVLVGDAAHPMTPDLGQGGCQAIEDAIMLAAALRQPDDQALARYDATRRRRVRYLVNSSRRMGLVLAARSAPISRLRDLAMPLAPSRATLTQMASIASTRAFERHLASL